MNALTIHDTLLFYSEWLDTSRIDLHADPDNDPRTHDDLVREFIADWKSVPGRAPLPQDFSNPTGVVVQSGDYPDEPDIVIRVEHAVDREGRDIIPQVAWQVSDLLNGSRAIKAAAWDEGSLAGYGDCHEDTGGSDNPYRADNSTGKPQEPI